MKQTKIKLIILAISFLIFVPGIFELMGYSYKIAGLTLISIGIWQFLVETIIVNENIKTTNESNKRGVEGDDKSFI